jgi:hypothetical protein
MDEEQNVSQNQEPKKTVLYLDKKRHYTLGIILLILGVFFLTERMSLIEFTWPLILLVIGIVSLVEAWLSRRSEGIFAGILMTFLGLIFMADGLNWITGGVSRNWPLVALALSLSFLISAAFVKEGKKHWIPGFVLLAIGGLFLIAEYGLARRGLMTNFLEWWPFTLFVVGIWLLLRKPKISGEIHGQ